MPFVLSLKEAADGDTRSLKRQKSLRKCLGYRLPSIMEGRAQPRDRTPLAVLGIFAQAQGLHY